MWHTPGLAIALLVAIGSSAAAQQLADPTLGPTPVLTVSPDRLFSGTLYGQAVQARIDDATRALQDENRTSEAELAAEEQVLTDRRATLPPAEFRVLAEAFDRKANGIRERQAAKARVISEMRDGERQQFFQSVLSVLGQIMTDKGAVAIIDQSTVFLSFDRIDITSTAIARIDALLGTGPDKTTASGQTPRIPGQAGSVADPDALPLGTPEQDGAAGSPLLSDPSPSAITP